MTFQVRGPRTNRGWLLLLSMGSFTTSLGLDVFVPALPSISAGLNVDIATTQLTMTGYLVGLGFGQFIAGPISDRVGRRPAILMGLLMVATSMWLGAASPSIGFLVVARVVSGLGAGAVIVCALTMVRDRYSGGTLAKTYSQIMAIAACSSIVAPTIGAVVLRFLGWRGLVAATGFVAAVVFWTVLRKCPETLVKSVDDRRWVKRLRSDAAALMRDRDFVGYGMVLLFSTAAFFATQAASSFVLQRQFGLTPVQYSLVVAASAAGLVAVSQFAARTAHTIGPRRLMITGMGIATLAVALIVISVQGLLAVLIIGLITLSTGIGMIAPAVRALAPRNHVDRAGSAFAILGLWQFVFAGFAAPLTGLLPWSTLTSMAVVAVTFVLLTSCAFAATSRTMTNTQATH